MDEVDETHLQPRVEYIIYIKAAAEGFFIFFIFFFWNSLCQPSLEEWRNKPLCDWKATCSGFETCTIRLSFKNRLLRAQRASVRQHDVVCIWCLRDLAGKGGCAVGHFPLSAPLTKLPKIRVYFKAQQILKLISTKSMNLRDMKNNLWYRDDEEIWLLSE